MGLIRAIAVARWPGQSVNMLIRRALLVLALAVAAAPLRAGTAQQDFDAAQAALEAGKLGEARTGFAALLARMGEGARSRSSMIVRERLAETMVLLGDVEEAEPLLLTALDGLAAGVPAVAEERANALLQLARVEEEQGRVRDALGHWQAVVDEKLLPAGSAPELQARLGIARTALWTQPDLARTMIEGLQKEPDAGWGPDPLNIARARILQWRLLAQIDVRAGDLEAAAAKLARASRLAGGTATSRVNLDDVQLRADLAVLAWLRKDYDKLAEYTAMSGAGMLDDGSRSGGRGATPPCAPVGTLAPDAMAVIEFGVRNDGRVLNVRPVYASVGSGPADSHPEEAFAAAVHQWSWPAEQAMAVNPLWRSAIRVELRCMTTQPDTVIGSLESEVARWLQAKTLDTPALKGTDAQRRTQLLAAITAVEAADGAQSPRLLPILWALLHNSAVSGGERRTLGARLATLAELHKAPLLMLRQGRQAASLGWQSSQASDRRLIPVADAAGEGRLADYLRLEQAGDLGKDAQEALLKAIAARRADGDPLRTRALVQLSDLAFGRGNARLAADALGQTGISPGQCALVDVRPESSNAIMTSDDFPPAAQQWHLSGYVLYGYDITPAGRTINTRVIMARPPFAFSDAVNKRVATWRFKPVLRGDQTVGCVGRSGPVRFRLDN